MYSRLEQEKSGDFLYLGDMLKLVHEKAFVDSVHYNEIWNERIAERVGDHISR